MPAKEGVRINSYLGELYPLTGVDLIFAHSGFSENPVKPCLD